jgi:CubicO group peptidase (beta-lactamase class C family)
LKQIAWTLVLAASAAQAEGQDSWDWKTAEPGTQGFSAAKLEALRHNLAARRSSGLLVIRNDRLVLEWYGGGFDATKPHYTASMAKAIVGGISTAVALDDGRLTLEDPASKFVPQWRRDPAKSKITVRQLGSHSSGLEDAEENQIPHDQLTGWKGDFWKRRPPPDDPFTISRDQVKLLFEPGTKFQYSNPGIAMLSYVVTASLKGAPEKDLRALLRDRVMRPIGVPDAEWSVGYGQTVDVDDLPLVCSWGGGAYTARATARVGRLMLRGGDWEGKQILCPEAVDRTTGAGGTPGDCGIGWWTNARGNYDPLPRDAFFGAGAGHQVLLVVPSLGLIAVRNGEILESGGEYQAALRRHLFEPLMAAVADVGANAPSPVIASIGWAPASEILRRAKGSDNWPLTWADDGDLYTAYGDGNGFEPQIREKLSLGFARVSGSPPEFAGTNIRSATGEQVGDGAKAKKASGMLMVDGVLHLWARNADGKGAGAQLAVSRDHGQTWTWSDWRFAEFGGCTILNFGRNYAGARDDYVYVYSHDDPSAYKAADRFVLLRVPKGKIAERGAYEFFAGAEAGPQWTPDVSRRGAVFTRPGGCARSGVTYNAGLKRYLWWQQFPGQGVDTRFKGGFGIYDAPEPWGPWTTVATTRDWDVGPGESASFPTKWMSGDGKTLYLVYSGNDNFAVRRATLVVR